MGNVEGAAQAIADALAPTQQSPSARWRWGTVASVQDDGTITATVGGATVSGIRASQQAMGAAAGDRVRICYLGTEAFADSLRASSKLMSLPTIDGALTATGRITGAGLTSTGAHLDVQSTNFTDAVTPSASYNGNGIISLRDKNGKEIGYVRPESFKDGYQGIAVAAKRTDGGTIHETLLRIAVNSAGSTWVGFTGDGKTAFQNALGATSLVIKRSKLVSVPANTASLDVTADTVSGYTFLAWLQPASSGHVTAGYMQDPTISATKLLQVGGTTTSARNWRVTALYVKS